jgi:hypothetical protein
MKLLPVRMQDNDLLVSLLAQSLPLNDLLIVLHHGLLRHPVLLSQKPVLIGDALYDSFEPALFVDSLILTRA